MFDYAFLNIGSILLGLIALAIPTYCLIKEHGKSIVLSSISYAACAISLCLQIFYNYYLVKREDWSALLDTIGAVAGASAVLVIVTIFLNVTSILVHTKLQNRS
ncbi:hypothetical protein CEQ21_23830 [Niallia circulans]|uniref:Uncharacterized protein n=1 Tax=Niallia circulans TaxID=1397 RepID=A0A553SN59_NIACI|nr:hypothetical protein [Niallia circulans]TRZ38424.1 hypothetical protein CEQ21_23830 [Niallia circulans]